MSVIPFPDSQFTSDDVATILALLTRKTSDGRFSHWVRETLPEADYFSVFGARLDNDMALTIIRERGRYGVYDEGGKTVATGATLRDVLANCPALASC